LAGVNYNRTSRLHALADPNVVLKRKSRIEGISVVSNPQTPPKLTQNTIPSKSQRPNTSFFPDDRN
jgi:hypothetical protein